MRQRGDEAFDLLIGPGVPPCREGQYDAPTISRVPLARQKAEVLEAIGDRCQRPRRNPKALRELRWREVLASQVVDSGRVRGTNTERTTEMGRVPMLG